MIELVFNLVNDSDGICCSTLRSMCLINKNCFWTNCL